jgi:DNA invertase Pin-like site-specific DNA recombinase
MGRAQKASTPEVAPARDCDGQFIAVYMRLSHRGRRGDVREPDPERKAELKRAIEGRPEEVRWYQDTWSGRSPSRPEWERLIRDIEAGRVCLLLCWRLDRLGMTCSELIRLFEYLGRHGVNLISFKDGLDLSTPEGRRMANVLASVAVYETEVRAERILAGQEAARARGVRWGGSAKGERTRVSAEQAAAVTRLRGEGKGISEIAREVGLSRPTVYRILGTEVIEPPA